jgi:hypothetical protein
MDKIARVAILKNAGRFGEWRALRSLKKELKVTKRKSAHATAMEATKSEIDSLKNPGNTKKHVSQGAKERFGPKVYKTTAMLLAGPAIYGGYKGYQAIKNRNQNQQYYQQ